MAGFDKRKNVPLLIAAFARSLPSLPNDVSLVLAGAPHSDNPTVFPPVEGVIRELGVADRLVLTGRVTNEERTLLYQGAVGYVTPSAYEGFGLTPLEAMACGVPVIAANRTSLPEVVGHAGLLVEPEIEAVAMAISRLLNDRDLGDALARRGLARAAGFTWSRTADLTIAAYREAVDR
jgi:glycosyltransferase involved in cell wall biosynthesis